MNRVKNNIPPPILYSFCYVSTSRRFYLLSNSGGMCLKEEDLIPPPPWSSGGGCHYIPTPPPVPWVGKASFSKFWLHLGTNIVYEIYRMSIKVCYLFKQHTCVELKVTPFLEKTFLSWYNTFQITNMFTWFLNMKKIKLIGKVYKMHKKVLLGIFHFNIMLFIYTLLLDRWPKTSC